MAALAHAEIPAYGSLDSGAIAAAYSQIISFTYDITILHVFTDLNQPFILSLDGGVTDHYLIPAFHSFIIDFQAGRMRVPTPDVQVKHNGVAPTAGFISVTGARSRN